MNLSLTNSSNGGNPRYFEVMTPKNETLRGVHWHEILIKQQKKLKIECPLRYYGYFEIKTANNETLKGVWHKNQLNQQKLKNEFPHHYYEKNGRIPVFDLSLPVNIYINPEFKDSKPKKLSTFSEPLPLIRSSNCRESGGLSLINFRRSDGDEKTEIRKVIYPIKRTKSFGEISAKINPKDLFRDCKWLEGKDLKIFDSKFIKDWDNYKFRQEHYSNSEKVEFWVEDAIDKTMADIWKEMENLKEKSETLPDADSFFNNIVISVQKRVIQSSPLSERLDQTENFIINFCCTRHCKTPLMDMMYQSIETLQYVSKTGDLYDFLHAISEIFSKNVMYTAGLCLDDDVREKNMNKIIKVLSKVLEDDGNVSLIIEKLSTIYEQCKIILETEHSPHQKIELKRLSFQKSAPTILDGRISPRSHKEGGISPPRSHKEPSPRLPKLTIRDEKGHISPRLRRRKDSGGSPRAALLALDKFKEDVLASIKKNIGLQYFNCNEYKWYEPTKYDIITHSDGRSSAPPSIDNTSLQEVILHYIREGQVLPITIMVNGEILFEKPKFNVEEITEKLQGDDLILPEKQATGKVSPKKQHGKNRLKEEEVFYKLFSSMYKAYGYTIIDDKVELLSKERKKRIVSPTHKLHRKSDHYKTKDLKITESALKEEVNKFLSKDRDSSKFHLVTKKCIRLLQLGSNSTWVRCDYLQRLVRPGLYTEITNVGIDEDVSINFQIVKDCKECKDIKDESKMTLVEQIKIMKIHNRNDLDLKYVVFPVSWKGCLYDKDTWEFTLRPLKLGIYKNLGPKLKNNIYKGLGNFSEEKQIEESLNMKHIHIARAFNKSIPPLGVEMLEPKLIDKSNQLKEKPL